MKRTGRALGTYLLLPRPGDLVKAWIFPAGFAVGLLAGADPSGSLIAEAAIVWFALELLAYQARYQWNDIRGRAADARHPQSEQRGRLPMAGSGNAVRASVAVIALRLALVAAIAVAVPDIAAELLVLTGAVFAVALLYELLRSRATGAGAGVEARPRPGIVALWLVVGGGYAVRGVGGLALAVDLGGRPSLVVAAVATMWCFGIAFVTIRWALEALPFAEVGADGLHWHAGADQAREHSLALVRWLPDFPSATAGTRPDPTQWRPLAQPTSPLAPWNLATVAAGAAAGVTGLALTADASAIALGLAGGCGGVLAACVLAVGRHRSLAVAAGALALGVVQEVAGSSRPLAAVLPWLLVVASHVLFCAQSFTSLSHPLRSIMRRTRASARPSVSADERTA